MARVQANALTDGETSYSLSPCIISDILVMYVAKAEREREREREESERVKYLNIESADRIRSATHSLLSLSMHCCFNAFAFAVLCCVFFVVVVALSLSAAA